MNYTKEQGQAVRLNDQNILVSAGAGAGKTRVLVDRIARMLLREENPVMADQLLVLTFTNAAAAEMKERISLELEELLEKNPDHTLLRRQLRLMKSADVSTVHSFCGKLIRTHFEQLGLDPAFRIGETGELTLLQKDVMEATLEEAYEKKDADFLSFVEAYAPGKKDDRLEEMVEAAYKFSRGFPSSADWYDNTITEAEKICDEEKIDESAAMDYFLAGIYEKLEIQKSRQLEVLAAFGEDLEPLRYHDGIENENRFIEDLLSLKTYDEIYTYLQSSSKPDYPSRPKKAETAYPVLEKCKACHTAFGDLYKDLLAGFSSSVKEICKENERVYHSVKVLIRLTARFEELYAAMKREKNVYDFDDLEHFALKLLVDHYDEEGNPCPTATALELREKYKEIFVDEYQDTNLVQETLLQVLFEREKNHIFMVGDVKQSIYRFRLARPDLFLKRYHDFEDLSKRKEEMEELSAGNDFRIELRDNFRSCPDVLTTCNFFFSKLMTAEFGGIDYDDSVALRAGENGPMHDHVEKSEILLYVEEKEKDLEEEDFANIELEGAVIVKRMKELKEEGYSYGDMVILLRSLKGYAVPMMEYLRSHGIPAICEAQSGYFSTREISLIMNYLSIVDNVYQDIPMASVLLSSFGGLTEEELASLKTLMDLKSRAAYSLYDLMRLYLKEGDSPVLKIKLERFLLLLEEFREEKMQVPIGQLIWDIYFKTGFYYDVLLMPEGEKRKENLLMFLSRAQDYEQTVYKGLFYFLRYMEQLRSYELELDMARDKDEDNEIVRIMSIHKSKGLEFPVVFVSGLSKKFNLLDLNNPVLFHPNLGLGMDNVDLENRERKTSFMKNAIKGMMKKESLEEELRVLYVAMTRARNRLILTGIFKEKKFEDPDKLLLPLSKPLFAANMLDWVSAALFYQKDFRDILAGRRISLPPGDLTGSDSFSVKLLHYGDIEALLTGEEEKKERPSFDQFVASLPEVTSLDPIIKSFEHVYDYEEDTKYKRKYSVSEIKHWAIDAAMEQEKIIDVDLVSMLEETEEKEIRKPAFLSPETEETMEPTTRGTIYHKVMELLPMGAIDSDKALFDALKKIEDIYEPAKDISPKKLYVDVKAFLDDELGKEFARMDASGNFHREVPFTVGIKMPMIYEDATSSERAIIQGIIDAYGECEEGIWLLDYKTDRIREGREKQLLDHYTTQMLYYKTALEQVLHKKVTRVYLYSFALHKFILVDV